MYRTPPPGQPIRPPQGGHSVHERSDDPILSSQQLPERQWNQLVFRPRTLSSGAWLRDRHLSALDLVHTAEVAAYTVEEVAAEFDLSIEAVYEAIRYVGDIRDLIEIQGAANFTDASAVDSAPESARPIRQIPLAIRQIPLAAPQVPLRSLSDQRPLWWPSLISRPAQLEADDPWPPQGQIIDLESRRRQRIKPN